jgi:hypothetical protein
VPNLFVVRLIVSSLVPTLIHLASVLTEANLTGDIGYTP